MKKESSRKISLIVKSEKKMEVLFEELVAHAVARHDISIQGSPKELSDRYGVSYMDPTDIKKRTNPPKTEAFLEDDFGWVVGLSYGIPICIGVVVGIFLIGDLFSVTQNFIFGALGALVGWIIGALIASKIKKIHLMKIKQQEKKGGFVIWVTVYSADQLDKVMAILKKHKAQNINVD